MRTVKRVIAGALIAMGCAREQPPVVGEPPAECFPAAADKDDVGSGNEPAPLTWIMAPLPVQQPDCAGLQTQSAITSSLTWRDRGVVREERVVMRSTTMSTVVGGRCTVRLTIEVLGGPAGKPGTIEPCHVIPTSEAWASLQEVELTLDALTFDGVRGELGTSIEWSDTMNANECRDAPPVTRDALGLVTIAEVSLPLVEFQRMTSSIGPQLAIGVRIDAR